MKKLSALIVTFAMLLSLATITANATEMFEPVGDVSIQWDGAMSEKITFDGDISEWKRMRLPYKTVDQTNLVTWSVNGAANGFDRPDAIGEDFSINVYFAADADFLYMAFDVTDDVFAYTNNRSAYNGDVIQIGIDWNRHMEQYLADGGSYSNDKNIMYSFSCAEDGGELAVYVQEGFKDRAISESWSDDPLYPDMRGSARATQNGWSAELALSWELLYSDYAYKTWDECIDDFGPNSPLSLGMTIYYMDRNTTNGAIQWAAGTFNDVAYPTWGPAMNGVYAALDWEPGREVFCSGICNEVGGYVPPPETETTTIAETVPVETSVDTTVELETEDETEEIHTHSFPNGWQTIVAADCTMDGYAIRMCSCGHAEKNVLPATGHRFTEGAQDNETTRTCTVCGAVETETIPEGTAAADQPEDGANTEAKPKPETETETGKTSGGGAFGCRSAIAAALLPVMALAGAVIARKKKD